MAQLDTETISPVAGRDGDGDRKFRSETPEDDEDFTAEYADPEIPESSEFVPPESFWLSKDSEFDWFDRNAFLERKESTKASNSKNLNPSVNPSYSRSNSQRNNFSVNLKSKTGILGLPKTQKNTHIDPKYRQCKPANIRLFPKRSGSSGRTPGGVAMAEPSSPKVSCIGRVRSKRCRSRRRAAAAAAARSEKPVAVTQPENQKSGKKGQKSTGIISRITSMFRSEGSRRKKSNKSSVKSSERLENSASRRSSVTVKPVNSEPATPSSAPPPALGGMNRFASGRRSESWTDNIDVAGRRSAS